MNKKVMKPLVLSVLFLAALIFFSITTNQDNKDLTAGMPEATLPVVQFYQDGTSVARLHGYLTQMDVTAMRDSVVPVDKKRKLPMTVDTYGSTVDNIRYEIRSLNGERLVARSDVTDYDTGPDVRKEGNKLLHQADADTEPLCKGVHGICAPVS